MVELHVLVVMKMHIHEYDLIGNFMMIYPLEMDAGFVRSRWCHVCQPHALLCAVDSWSGDVGGAL